MKSCVSLLVLATLWLCGCGDNKPVTATHVVALDVPLMACPYEDWRKVKQVLSEEPGIANVSRGPWRSKAYDPEASGLEIKPEDRFVLIDVGDDFDADRALKALAQKGYLDSSIKSMERLREASL